MPFRKTVPLVAATALAFVSICVQAANDKPRGPDAIKSALTAQFPDIKIVDVRPTEVIPGFYEVYTGDSIAYASPTGEYLLVGTIVETSSKRNLTAERVEERGAIDFSSLPLDRAIKTVKGNGKRQLAVFSDPECPYCQELEKSLETLTDVTVYTFLYPVATLHPKAPERARAIWCAKDPAAAWKEWMIDHVLAKSDACDMGAVDKNVELAAKLRITGTPTLFAANGRRASGAMATAEVEKLLETAVASSQPSARR